MAVVGPVNTRVVGGQLSAGDAETVEPAFGVRMTAIVLVRRAAVSGRPHAELPNKAVVIHGSEGGRSFTSLAVAVHGGGDNVVGVEQGTAITTC